MLALTHRSDMPIICNGYKDDDYIEMVVFAQKIGKTVIPVVEKFNELELIAQVLREAQRAPRLRRARPLSARGSGRWKHSGGDRSKFGLTVTELLQDPRHPQAARHGGLLQAAPLPPGQPDHEHPQRQERHQRGWRGSTWSSRARERGSSYSTSAAGLGIDYDGSQTNFESSVNYTLQEYANDVIFRVKTVCEEAGVKQPTIISESGRATVAYHSVLVFNVLGVSKLYFEDIPEELPEDYHSPSTTSTRSARTSRRRTSSRATTMPSRPTTSSLTRSTSAT